jgi:PEGA domain
MFEGVGSMILCRTAAVQAFLLLVAMSANAGVKTNLRITVLDSETRATTPDNNGVPLNCEQLTFDAYCRSTSTVPLVSTLLVQEGNEPPFRISCTIASKYSRCAPLPKGESFEAKREKHGITVFYVDDKGKERKQLYTLVADTAPGAPPLPAIPAAVQPSPPVHPPAPMATAPSPAPATQSVPAQPPVQISSVKVRCKFASTPAGADISIDDKYVGNTPSEIELTVGTHAVVFSMQGFTQWKRDLTVMSASELTVSAILQKQ